jgi:hypothetical protein
MPSTAGHIIAPPMPMSARHTISHTALGATAASSENPTKIAEPTKKTRRRPSVSARRPPVTMSTPKIRA